MELPDGAELLFDATDVDRAVAQVAVRIAAEFAGKDPVVICVMTGGLPFTWDLTRRLPISLELDYIHATRYRGTKGESTVDFLARPRTPLEGRNVLLVDDILDEGFTLKAVIDDLGTKPSSTKIAVLVDKPFARKTAIEADYAALQAPNDYLIGRGMDHNGRYRNLPAIYKLTQT